jgi:hypothetical protein
MNDENRVVPLVGTILALVCLFFPSIGAAQRPAPLHATHTVELSDPPGDIDPIRLSTGVTHPGFDVIKMAIRSDGKQITFSATLKDPPGPVANDVLQVYADTDNNTSTGASLRMARIGGFEFRASLHACVRYAEGSAACAGMPGGATSPTAHFAIVSLERFKGSSEFDKETLIGMSEFPSMLGRPASKAARRAPIVGALVEATLDYADLDVKPGQRIRLVVKESSSESAPDGGWFPDIVLTLK